MTKPSLRVTIRTPSGVVVDQTMVAMRVPTRSGQVGLRPGGEPCVLDVEAGLVVLRQSDRTRYAGTAGGLLHTTDRAVSLLTPLAVVGDDVESVSDQLDQLLSAPSDEMEARSALGRLEKRILQELQNEDDSRGSLQGSSDGA